MKRLVYLLIGIVLISACNTSNVEINGNIEDAKGETIVLNELLVSGIQFVDSVKLDNDGNFTLKANTEIPRFYQLAISKNNFLTLLISPDENVTIQASAKNLNHAKINGSDESLLVQDISNQLIETKKRLKVISKEVEKILEKNNSQEKINEFNLEYSKVVDEQRDSSIAFIVRNLNSMASIVALYQKYDDENFVLYKNRDIQYLKIVSEALTEKYPESEHVKALVADKNKLLEKYNQAVVSSKMSEIVNEAATVTSVPEIYLPNSKGDSISLNNVKSKYILLNFWASWSEESLKSNVIYKDIYSKYHSKGFEIYQVSLDTKIENWNRALKFDQIPGINVIDLNGRMSYYAKIYNVNKLPTSFLINPEREIVVANPTREQLLSTFEYNLK